MQIDTTPPTIAINTIASNNVVTKSNAASGFAIAGTTVGAENGRSVTVAILNSAQAVVDSYTATDQNNAWSVNVTSAQATALADGSYTVTANVSDLAGNPAPQASKALTVDEEKTPEPPILTIANTALNVTAGGSVALGITATPVDSDDRVSVKISGLPSYETITAPAGDTVSRQFNPLTLSYTYTITESASAAGTPLTGLTLTSHYTGTGHPVAEPDRDRKRRHLRGDGDLRLQSLEGHRSSGDDLIDVAELRDHSRPDPARRLVRSIHRRGLPLARRWRGAHRRFFPDDGCGRGFRFLVQAPSF